ncbi:RNA polymerase III subunit C82, partial [Serendipita sp. 399]
ASNTSATAFGEKDADDGEAVFEFNVDECLLRLRFGKYLLLAKELFGDDGLLVVQTILDHGRLRFSDLESKLPEVDRPTRQKLVRKMIQRRFLKSTSEYMNKPRSDRIAEMEHKLLMMDSSGGGGKNTPSSSAVASAKRLAEIRILAEERVKRLEEEAANLGLKGSENSKPSNSVKGKGKERAVIIDETVWLRVNFAAFNIQIRNSLIEEAVRARYNEGAAAVMRAVLIGTEESQLSLSDPRTETINSHSLLQEMQEDQDLAAGLVGKGVNTSPTSSLLKEYIHLLSGSDASWAAASNGGGTGAGVGTSQGGMAKPFLTYSSSSGGGITGSGSSKVHVDFAGVYRRLKQAVLDGYVRERWGVLAVRIVRILLSMGKMDEKQLAKVAMISPDDTLLEARNRTDVAEDESLLTIPEKQLLQRWEDKMMQFSVLETRVDEAIFILRELPLLDA